MTTNFCKYHGLGNDFVLIDRRGYGNIPPEVTKRICSRRTGVGADGILALYDYDGLRMRVFNSDGSTADMCGNGLRCFVAWLINELGIAYEPMTILTDAGPQHCIPHVGAKGQVTGVTVNLGPAKFEPKVAISIQNERYIGIPMTLGNPHFVIPRPARDGEAATMGPKLSTHTQFAHGANIEWLEIVDRTHANLVVYERGAGLTLACGTGGGGAAATGVQLGLLASDTELSIRLPGGVLRYRVSKDFSSVFMTGPVEKVYAARLSGSIEN